MAYGSAIGITDGLDESDDDSIDGEYHSDDDDDDASDNSEECEAAAAASSAPPQISFHHQLDREIRAHMPVSDSEDSDDLDTALSQIRPLDDLISAYTTPAPTRSHAPMSDHAHPLTRRTWGRVREAADLGHVDDSDLEPESDRDLFSSQPAKRARRSLESEDDVDDDDVE